MVAQSSQLIKAKNSNGEVIKFSTSGLNDKPFHLFGFDVGLSSLPDFILDTIDDIPGFSIEPGVGGFPKAVFDLDVVKVEAQFEFAFDAALRVNLDLGHAETAVAVTSALDLNDVPLLGKYANDTDPDIFSTLVYDTSKAAFTIDVRTFGATSSSGVYLDIGTSLLAYLNLSSPLFGNRQIGSDTVQQGTESFEIIEGAPGQILADLNLAGGALTGKVSVPTLPTLSINNTVSAGTVLAGTSDELPDSTVEGTGPRFAEIKFDPIPLIPVVGQFNQATIPLLLTPLLDVLVDYKLVTATVALAASLTQTLTASITAAKVDVTVEEKDANGAYHVVDLEMNHQLGETFTLDFSTGDHDDTLITENWTVTVHLDSKLDLSPFIDFDLGLLAITAIVNPILVDQITTSFKLASWQPSISLGSITLTERGMDVVVTGIQVVTKVDTHLPIVGTDAADGPATLSAAQLTYDGLKGADTIFGNEYSNTVSGGPGDDLLTGSDDNDIIHGNSGNDALYGEASDDALFADESYDKPADVDARFLHEQLFGGAGDDKLYAYGAKGKFDGGSDNDHIYVKVLSEGGQTIIGGEGDDTLRLDYRDFVDFLGQPKAVNLDFNGSPDGVIVAERTETGTIGGFPTTTHYEESSFTGVEAFEITGSADNDTIRGSDNPDRKDFISGWDGDDLIFGGPGKDFLVGGSGNDTVFGGSENDSVWGDAGDDVLEGDEGQDDVRGQGGNDIVRGGLGIDSLSGGSGDDLVEGLYEEGVSESLFGGSGNDTLEAGNSGDTLDGGDGDDQLVGFVSFHGDPPREGDGRLLGGDGDDILLNLTHTFADGGRDSDTYYVSADDTDFAISDGNPNSSGVFEGSADDRLVISGLYSDNTQLPDDYAFDPYELNPATLLSVFAASGFVSNAAGQTVGVYSGIESFEITGTSADESLIAAPGTTFGSQGDRIDGAGGNDFIDGTGGEDTLLGGAGDDTLVGDTLDVIDGGTGIDTLYWISGRTGGTLSIGDTAVRGGVGEGPSGKPVNGIDRLVMINGGEGNDTVTGGGLDDTLRGGLGNDRLDGLAGDDFIVADQGGDTVYGAEGDDYIDAVDLQVLTEDELVKVIKDQSGFPRFVYAPTDIVYGGAGDDSIYASNTASLVDGGTGNDFISIEDGGFRGTFDSTIRGGAGHDTIYGSDETEIIFGGTDTSKAVPDELAGNPLVSDDDDVIFADGGDDTIYGGYGADFIVGGAGHDLVDGGDGDDMLVGDGGDTLKGGNGIDLLERGSLGDRTAMLMDGGIGVDTAKFDYTGTDVGLEFVMSSGTVAVGSDLTLKSIERLDVTLSGVRDEVTGTTNADTIAGGLGADVIRGGLGNDVIYANQRPSGEEGEGGGVTRATVGAETRAPADIGGDVLFGDGGDDTIDVSAAATVDGGAGIDTLVIRGLNDAMQNVTLVYGGAGSMGAVAYTAFERLNYYADSERGAVNVGGAKGNDILVGSLGNDTLSGGGGSDLLFGEGGNDRLVFGSSTTASEVDGGSGEDTAVADLSTERRALYVSIGGEGRTGGFPGGSATTVAFDDPDAAVGKAEFGAPTIERLAPEIEAIEMRGAGGAMSGRQMADDSDGQREATEGFERLAIERIDAEPNDVTRPELIVRYTPAILSNIEHLDLKTGSGSDLIYGGQFADTISSGAGNDFVFGGGGSDIVDLGAGDDTLEDFGEFADTLTVQGGTGNDRITIGGQFATVHGGDGNDMITIDETSGFFASLDTVFGDNGDDTIVTNSRGTFDGGAGIDTLVADLSSIGQFSGYLSGPGTVSAGDEFSFKNFERLDLTFGSDDDVVSIDLGQHTLNGGAGDDSITVFLNDGPAPLVQKEFVLGGGVIYRLSNGMVLTGFETVDIVYKPVTLTGSPFDDTLTGKPGDDQLFGFGGNDKLDGSLGADRMLGGPGNDIYYVDNAGDLVIEDFGAGYDSVYSTIDLTIPDNVEYLLINDGGNHKATGNNDANRMTTLGGNDTLAGLGGNDTLTGGAGNDVLDGGPDADLMAGGSGNDTYYVDNVADNIIEAVDGGYDQVISTASHTLKATTERLQLVGSDNIDGTGGDGDNFIIGNAGNNVLKGGNGNDKLFGGDGNDTLFGDAGFDELTGGVGIDRFVFNSAGQADGDIIHDIRAGEKIDVSRIDANSLFLKDQAFVWIGDSTFEATAGSLRYEDIGNGQYLIEGDLDGDDRADFSFIIDGLLRPPEMSDFFL